MTPWIFAVPGALVIAWLLLYGVVQFAKRWPVLAAAVFTAAVILNINLWLRK